MKSPLFLICLGLSCTPRPGEGEFIFVHVTWKADVTARCFAVRASSEGQAPRTTKPMVRSPTDQSLEVVIFRDAAPREVTLEALGFSDEGCISPTGEQSDPTAAQFVKRVADTGIRLEVKVPMVAGMDLDGDGVPTPADCDDGNARIAPGVEEGCGDTFDNDCDGAIDCADSECAGKSCGIGLACSASSCVEAACGNNIDEDGDSLTDCADPDCELQSCGIGGTCHAGPDGGCL